ncbi:MAG: RNA-binding protein [Gammaproteobacteria bacterium]|jgi:cold-inducible RNA-binding protein
MPQNKIYVSNMPFSLSQTELESAFAEYGDIEQVNLITDKHSGQPRGFAFITFARQVSAENALAMDGAEFKGRKLHVSMAKEKDSRRSRRGHRR